MVIQKARGIGEMQDVPVKKRDGSKRTRTC